MNYTIISNETIGDENNKIKFIKAKKNNPKEPIYIFENLKDIITSNAGNELTDEKIIELFELFSLNIQVIQ
jgi:hypothetical protein